MLTQRRIERLHRIADEYGLKADIKESPKLGIIAFIKGNTYRVSSYQKFVQICEQMKDYEPPKPIDLTARLAKIEEAAIAEYTTP